MRGSSDPAIWPMPYLTQRVLFALLAGLLTVLAISGFFYARATRLEAAAILAENEAIARTVAGLIEAREEGHLKVLLSYAGRFRFREAIKRRDRSEALVHLRQLHESFPEVDRPFLSDPAGVVWAAYPEAPELYGRSFRQRDWYQGVSHEWRPYVSEVYEGASSRALGVVLVAPLRDLDGKVIGIIGSFRRLETLRQWLLPIRVPGGDLYVVDRKGQLVFHRTRTGPDHLLDYARTPVVERLLRGEEGVADLPNPADGEVRLSAYRRIPLTGWGLVVQREKNAALQRIRTLILVSGAVGLVLTMTLSFLGVVALRSRRQLVEANVSLHERSRALQEAHEQLAEQERQAVQARQAADAANRAKSEFLGRMSHELRTPLNAILGFAQLLQMEAHTPEQRESVEHILKGGRHLLDLINEVLDITRIETGRLHLSLEPVSVGDLLREVYDLMQRLAAERHVQLHLEPAADGHVRADRQRFKQVLLNLLANAIKYNSDGGAVTLACRRVAGDRLRLQVTDTGPGIPEALQARLFTPFDRLGAEQSGVEGTGLGLALSKRLVEAMGGSVGVESTLGEGSTFWVELPRAEPLALGLERPSAEAPAAAPGRAAVVLYIEDNLSNLRLIERVLAHRPDVKLLPAMQGRLGLELARQHRPSLILLDLHLPDLPGHEVLRHLQGDPRTRDIPVIVISADATPGQVQRLKATGAYDYLTKPLDIQRLLVLLEQALVRATQGRDGHRSARDPASPPLLQAPSPGGTVPEREVQP